jgi:nucleoside-diphosphate kinase
MAEQAGSLTFGIIKPDAVRAGKTGAVLQRVLDAGFKVRAMKLIHLTKPEAEGEEGTLRKEFANSIGENAVHGSDSEENAQIELAYFFSRLEFVGY